MQFFDLIPPLLAGMVTTIKVTFFASILATVMAFVAGWGRVSKLKPLQAISTVYIEFFRGTSVLVQLFWLFFALPAFGIELTPFLAAVIGLGLNIGAYGAEVFRGGVSTIPKGQHEAAAALSMNRVQTMGLIIVPQALVGMMPPFTNLLIELLKGTSLVSLITLTDLTFQGQLLRSATLRTGEIFVLLLVLYFAIAIVISTGMKWLERRLSYGLDRGGV
ncbi:MAG: ectoine/hydroxyectoine ABC transporter permease subunit EhuC [Elainellaceae cyanobacterium]